jgi:hypothetical protein
MGPLLCSMKKHILFEHPIAWCKWTNANLTFATKDQRKKKSEKRTIVGYGAIINHFGSTTPLGKMMWGKNNSWKTCYCLLPKCTCLFLLWIING